ncbi:AEC family transporter [Lentisphaera profundi]|uniref:AEC family transporter n=1 Tax=Lentisphaera profundi TaxID=1658616 RepID=A0ABY7VR98_9BACT|nr:AEC family transporter [Lentisphaera profundi]WDE96711.1 AEC family transporter [Lentisphaera profundi]
MSPAIHASLLVITISAAGFIAHRKDVIKQGHSASLTNLLIKVLMPALIFSSITQNEEFLSSNLVFMAPLMGFVFVSISFLISYVFAKVFLRGKDLSDPENKRSFVTACGMQNYGYIAIPVIATLFPEQNLIGPLLMHNVGVEIAMWTIACSTLRGSFDRKSLGQILNAPFITVIFSLIVLFSGVYRFIPPFFMDSSRAVGQTAIPIGLILVGATLSELFKEGLFEGKASRLVKLVVLGLLNRQIIIPIAWFALIAMIPMSPDLKKIMYVQAAMPAAFFTIVLSRHFGGNVRTIAIVSVASFVVSPISISIWLSFMPS